MIKTMTRQQGPKHKKLAAKPSKDSTAGNKKIKIQSGAATILTEAQKKTKVEPNETLAQAQKALRAAQAKVKHERQARAKAEKALAEAQEAVAAAWLKAEHKAQIRRVSFVVRLTVYEHGQIGRTEIEHVESSRKQNFLSLDSEHIIAFMKACIGPTIIAEPTILPMASIEKAKAPLPGSLRPTSNLIVSEVRVFRPGDPDFMTLVLTHEEPFGLKVRFQLQRPDSDSLTSQEPSYEMKVYANEVTSGKSKLLTTYSAKLIQDVLEYTASVEVPGLRPGLYRLFTVVILSAPIKMAGFYGRTIVNVT